MLGLAQQETPALSSGLRATGIVRLAWAVLFSLSEHFPFASGFLNPSLYHCSLGLTVFGLFLRNQRDGCKFSVISSPYNIVQVIE